jgi:signal transduction histidine kinase/CheY-like chemotaxis protein/putative methionine-R-sulfoxide reductase with GAF domain
MAGDRRGPPEAPAGGSATTASLAADTILLVEDEPEVATLLGEYLQTRGYEVQVARTGAEARAALAAGPVDLLLLDLSLPDGNGTVLMREAQSLAARPDVIVVTGHPGLASAIAAVETGAAGYITKPFELPRVGALVEAVIERRRLRSDNARLQAELAQRLREAEALLAISTAITSTLGLQEALGRICQELVRLVGADEGWAYLLDRDSRELRPCVADHGLGGEPSGPDRSVLRLDDQTLRDALGQERRAVWSDDVQRDHRFRAPAFRGLPHQSGLLVPLVLDDEIAGALYVVWRTTRRTFPAAELARVDAIAAQVALVLRNARLYETGCRQRGRLEALVEVSRRIAAVHEPDEILSLIVNEASRLVGAEASAVRLIEGDELVLAAVNEGAASIRAFPRTKAADSLSGLVVTGTRPVVIEDLAHDQRHDPRHARSALDSGYRSFLGVPLRAHGRTIGALNIYTKTPRHFTDEEVSLLTTFADQASLGIEKGQLYAERERRRREAEALAEVGRLLSETLDAEVVGQRIADAVRSLLEVRSSVVYHLDIESGALVAAAVSGDTEPVQRGTVFPHGTGVVALAMHARRPVATPDLLSDPRVTIHPTMRARFEQGRFRSVLAVPLGVEDRVIGALGVGDVAGRVFSDEEVRTVEAFAAQAALALRNARLHGESEQRRRQAEVLSAENARVLEEAEHRKTLLEQVFAATSDGILVLDLNGRITALNRRGGDLLALNPELAVGQVFTAIAERLGKRGTWSEPRPGGLTAAVRAVDETRAGDLAIAAPGARTLHWQSAPTRDATGAAVGITITFRDVTQEREVSRMKSDFVSFVTHQLRTPLSGIRWMLELAGQESTVPDEAAACLADARQAAERLIGLVNDLLDISRLESGRLNVALQRTSLAELTDSVVGDLGPLVRERGHRLSIEGADTVPSVVADPQLLRQVIVNLVSNAIKYQHPGGTIAIRMGRDGQQARWEVRDAGIGIPPEAQPHLFEKFYRADNATTLETEGTGLGLYLVRLIVEHFGGRIWCESAEGQGSTFVFALPARGGETA